MIRLDAAGEERSTEGGAKNEARHDRSHRKAGATAAVMVSNSWSSREDASGVHPDTDVVRPPSSRTSDCRSPAPERLAELAG